MKRILYFNILNCFLLCSCRNATPTENLNPPTILPTEPTVELTPTVPETEEVEVITPKYITIYLDIDWEQITEVYFNDLVMEYGPYDNNSEFKVEIEADSITKFDLDFKQYNSWWHIQDEYMSWNTESSIEVDMKVGETYIVSEVNWTYQWDNEEQKWYTCTINKV